AKHCDIVVEERSEPRGAAHPASRKHQAAHARRRVERAPESQKRTERKRKKDTVVAANPSRLIDPGPTPDHPVPAFPSVEPPHRFARGAAGLVEAIIILHRIGQVGAKWRIPGLIVDQFGLAGKRYGAAKIAQAARARL